MVLCMCLTLSLGTGISITTFICCHLLWYQVTTKENTLMQQCKAVSCQFYLCFKEFFRRICTWSLFGRLKYSKQTTTGLRNTQLGVTFRPIRHLRCILIALSEWKKKTSIMGYFFLEENQRLRKHSHSCLKQNSTFDKNLFIYSQP